MEEADDVRDTILDDLDLGDDESKVQWGLSDQAPIADQEQLRQVVNTILAISRRQKIAMPGWTGEEKDELETNSDFSVSPVIANRLAQFVVYCAREGMLDELKYACSLLPAAERIGFRVWILDEIPGDISPSEFVSLLPRTAAHPGDVERSGALPSIPKLVADALVCGWNEEVMDGPYFIDLPSSWDDPSEGQTIDVARWYAATALRYDSLGFSYHGYVLVGAYLAEMDDSGGAIEEKSDTGDSMRALCNQLYHYCNCLYDEIIPEETCLLDWMAMALREKVNLIVTHNFADSKSSPMTLQELLAGYVIPMLHGNTAVVGSWAPLARYLLESGALAKCTVEYQRRFHQLYRSLQRDGPSTAPGVSGQHWPVALAQALVATVSPLDLPSLQRVADVAEDSKPTLPSAERRLPSNLALVELVVGACYRFDDVHSGMEDMWRLVECTPTREVLTQEGIPATLLARLDALERALNTGEFLMRYLPVPALSIMIPARLLQESPDPRTGGGNRLFRFRYMQQLLEGCSFLFDRVESAQRLHVEAMKDANDERTNQQDSRHLEERVDRRVKFGQAVVMRICHDFGEKLETARREGNMSVLVNQTWLKLAEDLAELSRVGVFQSDLPLRWIGQLLLACLLHFRSTELKAVVSHVCGASPVAQSPKKELFAALMSVFGLTAEDAQALVLVHARHLTDSVASCCDSEARADLKSARELLQLIPDETRSADTVMELRFHEILQLAAAIELDFIPLQLRMRSPLEVARKMLSERPDAYYTLLQDVDGDSVGDFDALDFADSAATSPTPTLSKAKTAVNALKARPIPGQGLVKLFLSLASSVPGDADDADAAGSEAAVLGHTMRVVALLAGAALAVGSTEHAYCYCNYLLDEYRFNSAEAELQNEIVGVASLTMEALTNRDYQNNDGLGPALRDDLMCSLVATCSIEQFDRLAHLWRTTEPLPAFTHGLLLHDIVPDKLGPLDSAKVLLYESMAVLLKRDRYSSASMQRALEESSLLLVAEEALSALEQVADQEAVIALLEGTLKEVHRKLSKVQRMQTTSTERYVGYEVPPDERLIQQLVQKGFAKNGAKRAVLATRGASLNAALTWAIEHCNDADFDHPVTQHVRGAILTEESSRLENSLRNLRDALRLIDDVDSTYRLRAGLPERAALQETEDYFDSRASSVPVTAASSTPSSPAEFVTATTSPDRPTRRPATRPARPVQAKSEKKLLKQSLGARRIVDGDMGIAEAAENVADEGNSPPLSLSTSATDDAAVGSAPDSVDSAVTAGAFDFDAAERAKPAVAEAPLHELNTLLDSDAVSEVGDSVSASRAEVTTTVDEGPASPFAAFSEAGYSSTDQYSDQVVVPSVGRSTIASGWDEETLDSRDFHQDALVGEEVGSDDHRVSSVAPVGIAASPVLSEHQPSGVAQSAGGWDEASLGELSVGEEVDEPNADDGHGVIGPGIGADAVVSSVSSGDGPVTSGAAGAGWDDSSLGELSDGDGNIQEAHSDDQQEPDQARTPPVDGVTAPAVVEEEKRPSGTQDAAGAGWDDAENAQEPHPDDQYEHGHVAVSFPLGGTSEPAIGVEELASATQGVAGAGWDEASLGELSEAHSDDQQEPDQDSSLSQGGAAAPVVEVDEPADATEGAAGAGWDEASLGELSVDDAEDEREPDTAQEQSQNTDLEGIQNHEDPDGAVRSVVDEPVFEGQVAVQEEDTAPWPPIASADAADANSTSVVATTTGWEDASLGDISATDCPHGPDADHGEDVHGVATVESSGLAGVAMSWPLTEQSAPEEVIGADTLVRQDEGEVASLESGSPTARSGLSPSASAQELEDIRDTPGKAVAATSGWDEASLGDISSADEGSDGAGTDQFIEVADRHSPSESVETQESGVADVSAAEDPDKRPVDEVPEQQELLRAGSGEVSAAVEQSSGSGEPTIAAPELILTEEPQSPSWGDDVLDDLDLDHEGSVVTEAHDVPEEKHIHQAAAEKEKASPQSRAAHERELETSVTEDFTPTAVVDGDEGAAPTAYGWDEASLGSLHSEEAAHGAEPPEDTLQSHPEVGSSDIAEGEVETSEVSPLGDSTTSSFGQEAADALPAPEPDSVSDVPQPAEVVHSAFAPADLTTDLIPAPPSSSGEISPPQPAATPPQDVAAVIASVNATPPSQGMEEEPQPSSDLPSATWGDSGLDDLDLDHDHDRIDAVDAVDEANGEEAAQTGGPDESADGSEGSSMIEAGTQEPAESVAVVAPHGSTGWDDASLGSLDTSGDVAVECHLPTVAVQEQEQEQEQEEPTDVSPGPFGDAREDAPAAHQGGSPIAHATAGWGEESLDGLSSDGEDELGDGGQSAELAGCSPVVSRPGEERQTLVPGSPHEVPAENNSVSDERKREEEQDANQADVVDVADGVVEEPVGGVRVPESAQSPQFASPEAAKYSAPSDNGAVGWDDASLGSLVSAEELDDRSSPLHATQGPFVRAGAADVLEKPAQAETSLVASTDAHGEAWDNASLGGLDVSGSQPESVSDVDPTLTGGNQVEENVNEAPSVAARVTMPEFQEHSLQEDSILNREAVSPAHTQPESKTSVASPEPLTWGDADLEGLEVDEEDGDPGINKLGEVEAENTAVIESALEVAAELLCLNAAAFNATKAAMHVAAFDPTLHAAPTTAASTNGMSDEDDEEGRGDDTLQSVTAVYHMCRSLATSDREAAFDTLLQLLAAIPYASFHNWLAESVESKDLRICAPASTFSSPSLSPQQASVWSVTALRFMTLFGRNEDGTHLKLVLWQDSLRYTQVLARLYEATAAHDLYKVEFLKKAMTDLFGGEYAPTVDGLVDLLRICSSPGAPRVSPSVPVASLSAEEVLEGVKKQLQDDVAMLRRIGRVEGFLGVNCKAILVSGTLLSSREVFGAGADEEAQMRAVALRSLCPVLRLHTVAAWNRAVGRVLDVGPSQLHLFFALHQLHMFQTDELTLQEFSLVVSEVASKMKSQHVQVLCLRIAGVSAGRVEELKKVALAAVESAMLPVAVHDAEELNATLLAALSKQPGVGSGAASTTDRASARVSARSAAGRAAGDETLTPGELESLRTLVVKLLHYRTAIAPLPMDLQVKSLGEAFARPAAATDIIIEMLIEEAVSASQAKAACDALLRGNADLESALSRGASSVEEDVAALYSSFCQAWRTVFGHRPHNGDPSVAFCMQASQARSVLSKAAACLLPDELGAFVDMALELLVDLSAYTSPESSACRVLVTDVAVTDEDSWVASGLLEHCSHSVSMFAGIHLLARSSQELIGIGHERRERVFAVQKLLTCKCLIAALESSGALTAEEVASLQLYCDGVGADHGCSAGYDVTRDLNKLVSQVIAYVAQKSSDVMEPSVPALLGLSRMDRIADIAGDMAADPASYAVLQNLISGVGGDLQPTRDSSRTSAAIIENQFRLLRLLLQAKAYASFVEYLLLDVVAAQGGVDACRADILAILPELPVNSAWTRQVRMILGGAEADQEFEELETRLRDRNLSAAAPASVEDDPLGDAFTLLLAVWVQPSAAILQKALASPAVYPLLAALVLRLDGNSGSGVPIQHPFSLHRLLQAALRPESTDAGAAGSDLCLALPERWSARYLVALLVLYGRLPAAMELNWRALHRPRLLSTVEGGRASLLASLQRWSTERSSPPSIYGVALQIVTETL